MTALREAAQQALEALEYDGLLKKRQAITALRAALAQQEQEQEPVVYTGDVARTMLESGMTFHLGMPHAIVMKQMTRFYDLVCAEASLRAAAAFAIPPRREWQRLTNEEMFGLYRRAGLEAYYPRDGVVQGDYDMRIDAYARAVEAKIKEKNNG